MGENARLSLLPISFVSSVSQLPPPQLGVDKSTRMWLGNHHHISTYSSPADHARTISATDWYLRPIPTSIRAVGSCSIHQYPVARHFTKYSAPEKRFFMRGEVEASATWIAGRGQEDPGRLEEYHRALRDDDNHWLTLHSETTSFWIYTNVFICTKGETRVDMFIESVTGDMPVGWQILQEVSSCMVYLFADSLLVWRSFHACGRSLRKSLLPIVLLNVEIVLVISASVYTCLIDANPEFETIQTDRISNRLNAAALTSVAVTSLVSTVTICLQIWRRTALIPRSRKHYLPVIKALIESSAIYAVSVLFLASLNFANTGNTRLSLTVVHISEFVSSATLIISGMAPTFMIAVLVASSDQEDSKFSSARLPSDLIKKSVSGTDSEAQRSCSIGAGEEGSDEVQAVPRNQYHGQAEEEVENRLVTVV
ncbi:hypothetical protein D9613_010207 [Agrocybe pediades]|uniref:Transmembrane protein n=1 Tax=Agrocybe pediades TaxID=84607 RepID=A0A8H4QFU5_9AGAR|nr:hypothetical protein D9613_010207 [Agrocybe pediades]